MKKQPPLTAVIVAVAVGLFVIVGLLFHHGKGNGGPTAAPTTGASTAPPTPKPTPAPISGHPVRVVIPSIGTDARVIPVGAAGPGGGALSIPQSVNEVGWWNGVYTSSSGTVREKVPAPGQPGVALLAGHVDSSVEGPGALYHLDRLKPGATVTVIVGHGKATHWKVTRIQTVLKSELPAALFVNQGKPRLALVSCGGPFDSATGHYLDNIIAWGAPA